MDPEEVLQTLRLVPGLPEPAVPQGHVALRRQVPRPAEAEHRVGVHVVRRDVDDVLHRVGREAVLVADPPDVGVAHVEDHGTRLMLPHDAGDPFPVVDTTRGSGAVEPHLDEIAVLRAELGQLRAVDLVVGDRIRIARLVPVPGREVKSETHPGLGAGIGELADDVAVAVPPGARRDRVVRRRGRPEAEPVVVLRGEHDVRGSRRTRGVHPLPRVELRRIEPGCGQGAVAPLHAEEGVEPEVQEDADAVPLPLQLGGRGVQRGGLRGDGGHRVRGYPAHRGAPSAGQSAGPGLPPPRTGSRAVLVSATVSRR